MTIPFDSSKTRSATESTIPSWRKVLYSLGTTLVFFALLEFLLGLAGVRPVLETEDPFVGFSNSVPLMMEVEASNRKIRMVTRPSKLVWFNRQWYEKTKPRNTKRIFCLGGSTTYGRPFFDRTSFCGWLREILPLVEPETNWEVINLGGISYASYRVAQIMEEVANHEPDAFIVYSAQNEFLENRTYDNILNGSASWQTLQEWASSLRSYSLIRGLSQTSQASAPDELLPAEVDERLNHTIGPQDYTRDPEWIHKVLTHYEFNLRRMARLAEQSQSRLLFVTPVSNEKDCSPFKSVPGLANSDEAGQGPPGESSPQGKKPALDRAPHPEAIRQAALADPQNADLQYRLGRALMESGSYTEAQSAFQQAIDEDVCPLRATSAVESILRNVSHELAIPLVDFEAHLRRLCEAEYGHPVLGDEFLLDHVHPTIEAHFELALMLVQSLQQQGLVENINLNTKEFQTRLAACKQRVLNSIDQTDHGISLRNLAKVLHWSGKFEEASARASDALEMLPGDPESRFVLADSLKNLGQQEHALVQYELLMEDSPDYGRAYLPFGELLLNLDETDRAMEYLQAAKAIEPENAYLYFTLGKLFIKLEAWQAAVDSLEQANQLYPDHATRELLDASRAHLDSPSTADQ